MASNALGTAVQKNNRRAMALAVVAGLVSVVLVLSYLKTAKRDGGGSTAMAPAVFAVRDIPERTVIKESMIEVRQIPVDARHALALQEANRAVGQITRVPVAAGEQMLSSKIADQVRDVGFSAAVPEGKRAVAVGVTEVIATGGHIAPGDSVDVIGIFEVHVATDKDGKPLPGAAPADTTGKDQSDRPKIFTAVTLLQGIQVLAVAKNADATLQTGTKKDDPSKGSEAKSVTLAVTPEQAEKLALSESIGQLRLTLRAFGDNEQRKIQGVTNSLSELVGN